MPRREFPTSVKRAAWDRCDGKCQSCGAVLKKPAVHYDHILPCALGGEPVLANCSVVCVPCHQAKTGVDVGRIRKADRAKNADIGAKPPPKQKIKSRGFPKAKNRVPKPSLPPRQLYMEK